MQAMHSRHMEGNSLQHVFATCIYLRMQFHRGGGSGGTAARQGNQGISVYQVTAGHGGAAARQGTPVIKLPVLHERLSISSSKVLPDLSALHDVPPYLAAVQSPGPPRIRHHPALVTRQPRKVRHIRFPRRTIYDLLPHRQRRRHILAASSPLSSRQ